MTSESFSLKASVSEPEMVGRGSDVGEGAPVESLWTDGLELVTLLPPGAPGSVLEPDAVGDLVLVPGHVSP